MNKTALASILSEFIKLAERRPVDNMITLGRSEKHRMSGKKCDISNKNTDYRPRPAG